MNRKIIAITAVFIIIIIAFYTAAVLFLYGNYSDAAEDEHSGFLAVMINETAHLAELLKENPGDSEALARLGSVVAEMESHNAAPIAADSMVMVLFISCVACVLFAACVLFYCRLRIIKPFSRLERFAGEVAKGNLDFPLEVHRTNIFGAFTWAFDIMRTELLISRENEEAAKRENKTLIATISHDIKTPVSSIRAYAEGLRGGMGTTQERRERYLDMIIKKSDEVAKLTNDLFLHALSDMEKLQLEIKEHSAKALIGEILDPFFAEYGDLLRVTNGVPDAVVIADEKRLAQVFGNVISNAAKYAPGSDIELSFKLEQNRLVCQIRDFGPGIPPGDMPFIWNRFYRGANSSGVAGSGLGLFIVKYITKKSGGSVRLENSGEGLAVVVSLVVEKNTIS